MAIEKNFTKIPNRILKSPDLSTHEKMVYTLLLVHFPAYASLETLAKWGSMSVSQVKRSIANLVKHNEIRVYKRGRSNCYSVTESGGFSTEYVRENGLK